LHETERRVREIEMDLAKNYATEAQLEKVINEKLAPVNEKLAKIIFYLERKNDGLPLS
jgi:hypothetical protein